MKYIRLWGVLNYIGMAMIIIGTIAALAGEKWAIGVLAIGVLPILGLRLYNRFEASSQYERINTILVFSSLVIICGIVALYLNQRYWIVCMFLAAILDGYASFRKLS
jgi:hypothetical protein